MTTARIDVSRSQVLSFRRRVGGLDARFPPGARSLRRAAWAGLQDSMPRAALMSIHARVQGTEPSTWEDPSLAQIWGPRHSVFVIAARDLAVFTRALMPDDARKRHRAEDLARRLHDHLGNRHVAYADAGRALGVHPNSLRYASPTGTLLIRWEGARQPTIWTVPPPPASPRDARIELARRYLHVYGPTTAASVARWAGLRPPDAATTFDALSSGLAPVRTPIGDSWILAGDEQAVRAQPEPAAPARLLPSGDAYILLQGIDRQLLVPDERFRRELWTPRVWPGGILLGGEIVGTWRRAGPTVNVQTWRRLLRWEREAVEAEAASLPLPGVSRTISVRWEA